MLRTTAALLSLAALASPLRADGAPSRRALAGWSHNEPPGIRIWTSHGEVYRRGQRVRLYFRTERDAYVLILRADTDGRLRVLFPSVPSENNYVRGGATYDVPTYSRHSAFVVDDDPGVGYVFAVAAQDPFLWERWTYADHWELGQVGEGRVHGDPYTSLEELIQGILPDGYADYDTHLLPYHVEQHYDYPRFVCYDCHTHVGYSYWNPYRFYCSRFTLFVYTDPYYFYPSYWYPTRYYGGTRVIYVRPGQRDGRYVFKPREDQTQPGIAYRDRRTEATTGERRPADRGVRGADIGGVGSVGVPGRRHSPEGGQDGGGIHAPGRALPERSPAMGGGVPTRRTVTPGRATTTNPPAVSPGVAPEDGGRRRPVTDPGAAPGTPPRDPREVAPPETGRRGLAPDPYPPRPTPREPLAQPVEPPRTRGITRPEGRADPQKPRLEPRAPDARAEPRAPTGRPEPRGPDARPEPRTPDARPTPREPARAEPRSAPSREPRAAPPPRAQPPRSAPPRAEPRAASPPRQESPRSPSPTLTRRRP